MTTGTAAIECREGPVPNLRPSTLLRLLLLAAAGAGTALLWVSLIHVRRDDVRLEGAVPAVADQSIFSSVQPRRKPAAAAPDELARVEAPAPARPALAAPAVIAVPAPVVQAAPAPASDLA